MIDLPRESHFPGICSVLRLAENSFPYFRTSDVELEYPPLICQINLFRCLEAEFVVTIAMPIKYTDSRQKFKLSAKGNKQGERVHCRYEWKRPFGRNLK